MKKLRFFVVFVLTSLLAFCLFACGGSDKSNTSNNSGTDSEISSQSSNEDTSSHESISDSESQATSEDPQPQLYTVVIASTSQYGVVTADKTGSVEEGTTVNLTVTANENCKLDYVKLNNVALTVTNGKAAFQVTCNSEITYSFSQITYNIICAANPNGSISTLPAEKAVKGATVTVTATPASGYILESITLTIGSNSTNLGLSGNTATFTMPEQNVSLSATFAQQDTREYVSHLVLGDSLAAINHWQDFYADFAELPAPKIIGVGGTCVGHWITGLNSDFEYNGSMRSADIVHKYNVSNFIFHVCDNDIDGGRAANDVIADLKTMFTAYHNAYPNAKIYWNTMSYSSFDARHPEGYTAVNNAIKAYAQDIDYLTVIDTASVMFPDNQPVADWFIDGTHFNADGLATWSALLLDALGYPRAKAASFGQAGNYYTSSTFSAYADGTVSNQGRDQGEQSVWFDGVYAANAYAEMKVTVNSITNNDEAPKFGISLKSNGNHAFFYIDANTTLTKKDTGFTQRVLGDNGGDWNWLIGLLHISQVAVTGDYANGNYIKLGVLKSESDVYFFVNDVMINSVMGIDYLSGNAAFGLTVFNLNVTIKDYSITTDIDSVISRFNVGAAVVRYDDSSVIGNFLGSPFNNDNPGEGSVYVHNLNASKFYYETNISLRGVFNDEFPKAGIAVKNNVGTLLFYIDAVNNDPDKFGETKRVGYVFRPNNGSWDWDRSNSTYALGMEYVKVGDEDHYQNIALLKDGAKLSFLVNGVPVIDVERSDFSGNVQVGIMEFNLSFGAINNKAAVSSKIVDKIKAEKGIVGEVVIDGNISEWTSAQKAKSYSMKTADGVRGFTAYAFRGQNAVYIAIEMVSSTFVNNSTKWWESTNAELRVAYAGALFNDQTYVSANGLSNNVRDFKITTSQNGGYYTTIIEISISLSSIWYENEIGLGFAACTGGETAENVNPDGGTAAWWPGANWPIEEVVKV